MKTEKELFISSLKKGDLETINKIPKSDLHCHAERGANKRDFERGFGIQIPKPTIYKSIADMDEWFDNYIGEYTKGYEGMVRKYISLFKNAEDTGVRVFCPSFCLSKTKYFDGDTSEYIKFIRKIQKKYAPNMVMYPELQLNRNTDIEKTEKVFEEAIKYDFFKSVDIFGNEKLGTKKFKDIYEKAGKLGWILKAHVGEFEDVSYIYEAIENLNLDAINHGLSAIESDELMRYLSKSGTLLNISPTSNVLLSRVSDYSVHPIRKFIDNGIACSINTDDLLVFDQTVSQEYLNMYRNGVLTPEELDKVREDGMSLCLRKRRNN